MLTTTLILLASSLSSACLIVKGSGSSGFTTGASLDLYDNGVWTCSFSGGGQGYGDCNDGYSMHFNWEDNPATDDLAVTYSNPENT